MKRTKSLIVFGLIAIFFIPVLNSCKKGEEDPGISFKSRDGRITGTWNLESAVKSRTVHANNAFNESITNTTRITGSSFTGTEETRTEDIASGLYPYKVDTIGSFKYSLTINKDGSFESKKTKTPISYTNCGIRATGAPSDISDCDDAVDLTDGPEVENYEGYWFWLGDSEKKTKVQTNIGLPYFGGTITRLSNSEMQFIGERSHQVGDFTITENWEYKWVKE